MAQIVKGTFETVNTISNKTVLFLKNSLNIFTDVIINGIKFKNTSSQDVYYYYKYINVLLIALVIGVIYYLHSYHNLFGVKNTQYAILGTILLFSIGILYFLFIVFRNNNNNKINSDDRPKLDSTREKDKSFSSKDYSAEDYSIENEKIKNTYLTPLRLLFMYVGLLLIILISIIYIVNYILFSQKNTNVFSITQSLISITIVIVVLAIIASILSIKSKASNET